MMLTVKEFLIYMKISMNTFRKWKSKGLPIIKQDGIIRIELEEALNWLRNKGE
jgi:phage terminase Nu1 subunit (DNA packaging protein)